MATDPMWVFENYAFAAAAIDELEDENAKLRAELERLPVDGWKLVPVEPTEEMLESDFISCHCGHDFSPALFDHVWHKMLAAAPSATATVQGDEYRCRKCGEKTPPPEPYKAYVLCDCGYMTSATAAIAAARKEGGKV